jgi:hypothetical protein
MRLGILDFLADPPWNRDKHNDACSSDQRTVSLEISGTEGYARESAYIPPSKNTVKEDYTENYHHGDLDDCTSNQLMIMAFLCRHTI